MPLSGLVTALLADPAVAEVLRSARAGDRRTLEVGAPDALQPLLIGTIARDRPVLAITATGREAEDLAAAMRSILPGDQVVDFPAWETLPHERLSPRSDTVGRRLAVLRRLRHPEHRRPRDRPAPAWSPRRSEACCSPSSGAWVTSSRSRCGPGTSDRSTPWSRRWQRRVHPRRPGRAAWRVRGPRRHPRRLPADRGAPAPGRVLGRHGRGGPLVQGRRPAQPGDRRRTGCGPRPCRELLLTDEVDSAPEPSLAEHPASPTSWPSWPRASRSRAWSRWRRCSSTSMELLTDTLPTGTIMVVCDPERVRTRAHDLVATSEEFLAGVVGRGGRRGRDARSTWARRPTGRSPTSASTRSSTTTAWWTITPFAADEDLVAADEDRLAIDATPADAYRGDTARAFADIKGWLGDVPDRPHDRGARPGRAVRRATAGRGSARACSRPTSTPSRRPDVVHVATCSLAHGFVSSGIKLVVLTETDLVGQKSSAPRTCAGCRAGGATSSTRCSSSRATTSCTSSMASAATSRWCSATVQGATREYLVIEYAPAKRGQPGRSALRPHRPARPGHPVRRRRGAVPAPARWRRLAEAKGRAQEGGQADRRRARSGSTPRGGLPGPRLRPGHALAARAGGCVSLRGDA